ncbi:MAG: response regulator [Clostridia bacterium]|nr:response regulator [Clostridia bacterium]
MRRKMLSLLNIFIITGILIFVAVYSRIDHENAYYNQVDSFENMTVALENITQNYLEGEQGICDVWARYINNRHMTLEEATLFIRESHVLKNTSSHLIYSDTMRGLSTRSVSTAPDEYEVDYRNVDIIGDGKWIADISQAINISRAYTNPMNGEQSLAFINRITVYDETSGTDREAYLLRIVPISDLEEKWAFPQSEFKNAEISVINANGDYIIKGGSFKSSNFFEFYKSYNQISNTDLQDLKESTSGETGSFVMKDSRDNLCVIAHTPVRVTNGWVMLNYIQRSSLDSKTENWILIGVITVGLLFLLAVNTVYMRLFNKKLQQMAKEAESANKAKTVFLSTMSHDIRTPMNAIIGMTTIAEKKIDDPKTVSESLHKISMASNHLLTLINDILDISKVESGNLSLNPIPFSIVESIENLVNISQPMIKEKMIDFDVRIDHVEKEYLYADNIRLNQIYINILSNAIKYTQAGGRICVDLREEESTDPGSVRLTFIVADNGMGMSPEFMKVMYQPFLRQTDSRVNSIQGTGLGLAITKSMVDLMHGTIDCQSELGKGTTFTITIDLPVADKQPDSFELGPIDILVVDDDPVLIETATDTIESLGASAEKAGSGPEALEIIRSRQKTGKNYDIVIVDWKMAGMDGVETAKQIRSEFGNSVPILLVSAYDWSEIETSLPDIGINGFISKPLFRSTLYEKINEILGVEAGAIESEDDYADLAGTNVLVAEDNEINWEIIHTLLEMYGIGSERAENGSVCVEKLNAAREDEFDLVFMDIQMPVMNGIDATKAIRKFENRRIAQIPIIAMTADAFSENISECLNAGMNGHIAKPVDIKIVIREIRKIKEKKQ